MYIICPYIRCRTYWCVVSYYWVVVHSIGNLLGVNRDVIMLNMDCIIPFWGSSSRSFTVAMLELSGCLTSSWHSMMRLVGVVKMGTLASIVVLIGGPVEELPNFVCGLYSASLSNSTALKD